MGMEIARGLGSPAHREQGSLRLRERLSRRGRTERPSRPEREAIAEALRNVNLYRQLPGQGGEYVQPGFSNALQYYQPPHPQTPRGVNNLKSHSRFLSQIDIFDKRKK